MLFVGLTILMALPAAGQERQDPVSGIDFIWVAEGCFQMGSPDNEAERGPDEDPVHEVCVDGFWMGKYEVTQTQWEKVMGSNPSFFTWDSRPVENVSWNDTQEFLQKLNAQAGKEIYRLPTEAEWEYAARAGTETAYSFGADAARLDEYAWYKSNSGNKTHPVGLLKPNDWGFYDMYGNVTEWCQDWYESGYYSQSPSKNPQGPSSGKYRVQRGGSWSGDPYVCRSANRHSFYKLEDRVLFNGFRVVAGSGAEAQFLPPSPLKASEALIDTLDLNRVMVNAILLSSPGA
jgi:formylglycine-generating enzyme required for sulfatase activity